MNTEQTKQDNIDAAYQLKAASLEASANEIKEMHIAMMRQRDYALEQISGVCEQALSISAMVEQVHGSLGGAAFAKWWRDNEMPIGWGKKYMTLAKTKRDNRLADKDQMRLIGIIPEPDTHNDQHQKQKLNPFAWIKWCSKIHKTFDQMDITTFDDADRFAALEHLKPIKEIINQLESCNNCVDV